MQQSQKASTTQYKAFFFLAMIYITLILSADVLIYKIIHVGWLTMTVGSLVTPFWFMMTDIIAEVYGYQLTRRLIWAGIICGFVFMVICSSLIQLPSPFLWPYQSAYDQVLGKLPRVFLGSFLGIMAAAFANTYLLTKWKILVRGKYFWIRSIGSSAVGLLVFTIITLTYDLGGIVPISEIVEFISISCAIKFLIISILAAPSAIVAHYLKGLEDIDIYDHATNFNPFSLAVNSIETNTQETFV